MMTVTAWAYVGGAKNRKTLAFLLITLGGGVADKLFPQYDSTKDT